MAFFLFLNFMKHDDTTRKTLMNEMAGGRHANQSTAYTHTRTATATTATTLAILLVRTCAQIVPVSLSLKW
jgi:hypothetical protein